MSDSDASTVDPEDLKETKTALSDSDASTVDPDNLEDTIPLDSSELRNLNNSPDLFVEYPLSDVSKKNIEADKHFKAATKTVVSKKDGRLSEQREKEKNKVKEKDLLKPTVTQHEKLVKRRSKVHELSDSGSDIDEGKVTTKRSSDIKEKPRDNKKDITQNKPYKKDYSKTFDTKSDTKASSKEKVDKQKFISDFLSMCDEDVVDNSCPKKVNKSKKEEKSKAKSVLGKQIKTESEKQNKLLDKETGALSKGDTNTTKVKQRKVETYSEKNGSTFPAPVSLKRKSSSPSPQVLKKSDLKILDTDKNTNSNGSVKPPCKYGSKCYRKNPSHRQEFSHPGKELIKI